MVDQIIDERWQSMSDTVNGWRGSLAGGRCSYDWSLNAANTKNQLGTELADQVVYLNCRVDADGQPFDGANDYLLHFDAGQTPPVWGMWNLAMYDEGMLFIPNEIDRFTIGSTTDGVAANADGSLTAEARPPATAKHRIGYRRRRAASTSPCGSSAPQPRPRQDLRTARGHQGPRLGRPGGSDLHRRPRSLQSDDAEVPLDFALIDSQFRNVIIRIR